MIDKLILWFVGAGATSSVLMWWFRTRLQVHLVEALRCLCFWKTDDYWSVQQEIGGRLLKVPLEDFSSSDLESWFRDKLGDMTAELFSCPGCFSAHVSLWVSVAIQLFNEVDIPFFLSCLLTWPVVANCFLSFLNKQT